MLETGAAHARGRRSRRVDLHAAGRSSTRTANASRAAFAPAFIASTVAAALRVVQAGRRGASRSNASQVAIDEATAQRSGLQHRPADDRRRHRRHRPLHDRRHPAGSAAANRSAAPGAALLLPAEAQRLLGKQRPLRPDRRRGAVRASRRSRCAAASAPSCRAPSTCAPAPNRPSTNTSQPRRQPRLPAHVPADLRLRRAASSARSSSSTPSRSRSRSACASSALLRTLGASRGQILRSVVYEGLLLGVIGAVLGLLAGIGVAPALDALFKAVRRDAARLGHGARDAHDRRLAARRRPRDACSPGSRRRCARPACRRWRRCARASQIPPRAAADATTADPSIHRFVVARGACRADPRQWRRRGGDRLRRCRVGRIRAAPRWSCALAPRRRAPRRSATGVVPPRSATRSARSCAGAASPGASPRRTRCASPDAR